MPHISGQIHAARRGNKGPLREGTRAVILAATLIAFPMGSLAETSAPSNAALAPGYVDETPRLADPSAQSAADEADEVDKRRGVWSFVWENDYFADTDQNYTNGVRFSYVSPPQRRSSTAFRIVDYILGLEESEDIRFGAALGHNIYTPESTVSLDPPMDEHPYAGWLYGEYSLFVDRGEQTDTLAFQLGMVGPSAQGEWVQNNFHEVIDSYEVLGWDTQLRDEPGFNVIFERKEKYLAQSEWLGLQFDATPSWGFTLGNVRTDAKVGVMLRLGSDLKSDFGPPRIRPSLGGVSYFDPQGDFSWYLFGGLEGRAVARNIFLDGNTFRDSRSVDKKIFVGDAQFGAVMQFQGVQLGYTGVLRTPEFDGQAEAQYFGAVSLSVRY
ncbi:MAG: lipid A deacylase LpxR family protein [Neomegalonema sp.]|nr:lipid A deacylase LpxR family protein [Neomegalonema sp.]